MLRARILALVSALLVPAFPLSPAHAGGATAADCIIVVRSQLSPGVDAFTPRSGTHDTHGETGSITCTGTFDGQRVTGNGSFGFVGDFTGVTCLSDARPLAATYSLTMPTERGPMHFRGTMTDMHVGALDVFHLEHPGARFTGASVVVPTVGDCVVTPVTEVMFTIVGSFRS